MFKINLVVTLKDVENDKVIWLIHSQLFYPIKRFIYVERN